MAAPRSVELDEDILVVIQDDVCEALSFQHLHVAREVFWTGFLALQGGFQVAVEERSHECFHALDSVLNVLHRLCLKQMIVYGRSTLYECYRSTVRILLDAAAFILQVADDHGGIVALREAKVLGDSAHKISNH